MSLSFYSGNLTEMFWLRINSDEILSNLSLAPFFFFTFKLLFVIIFWTACFFASMAKIAYCKWETWKQENSFCIDHLFIVPKWIGSLCVKTETATFLVEQFYAPYAKSPCRLLSFSLSQVLSAWNTEPELSTDRKTVVNRRRGSRGRAVGCGLFSVPMDLCLSAH